MALLDSAFVHRQPGLPGTLPPLSTLREPCVLTNYEIQFNTKPGSENRIDTFAEPMLRVLEFYTQQYGPPAGRQ